jgi:DNA-binding NarL/FixJ family response regulator
VIVSDDPLFVQTTSLGFRADPRFLVFHCLASTRAPAQAASRVGADVVLIDGTVEAGDRLEVISQLSSQFEPPPVLVLSDLVDPQRDRAVLGAGATMVLSREILGSSLVGLVAALAAGHVLVAPVAARAGDRALASGLLEHAA